MPHAVRSDELQERLRNLQGIVFDCDGVLTNSELLYDQHGTRLLSFHAKDGFGLAMLCKRHKFPAAVLSGRPTDIAEHRFRELGVREFYAHARDKAAVFLDICSGWGIDPAECAHVGDDIPDLYAFGVAGLKIAVADAAPEVKDAADCVTTTAGGHGAVREICEAILKAHGAWQEMLESIVSG